MHTKTSGCAYSPSEIKLYSATPSCSCREGLSRCPRLSWIGMMDGGVAVLPHAFGGLAPPRVPSWCRGVLARVLLAGDAPVRDWRVVCRQTEDRFEGHVAVEATVVAENKLVEVGVEAVSYTHLTLPTIY